jgi:hypothetical protein
MTAATRRAVAYIAGRLVTGRNSNGIYDFDAGNHFNFSGTVEPGRVHIFDYTSSCHIGGSPGLLYHHGTGGHLNLKLRQGRINGYDFHSGAHFSGTVSGSKVSIHDFETGNFYNYSV